MIDSFDITQLYIPERYSHESFQWRTCSMCGTRKDWACFTSESRSTDKPVCHQCAEPRPHGWEQGKYYRWSCGCCGANLRLVRVQSDGGGLDWACPSCGTVYWQDWLYSEWCVRTSDSRIAIFKDINKPQKRFI